MPAATKPRPGRISVDGSGVARNAPESEVKLTPAGSVNPIIAVWLKSAWSPFDPTVSRLAKSAGEVVNSRELNQRRRFGGITE